MIRKCYIYLRKGMNIMENIIFKCDIFRYMKFLHEILCSSLYHGHLLHGSSSSRPCNTSSCVPRLQHLCGTVCDSSGIQRASLQCESSCEHPTHICCRVTCRRWGMICACSSLARQSLACSSRVGVFLWQHVCQ